MLSVEDFIDQVRQVLIEHNDVLSRHEVYSRFVNECMALNLSEEDFYKIILKPAHKSIDWVSIEETNRQKEQTQLKLKAELKEKEEEIKNAPVYIDRLLKIAFEDGIVEGEELSKIFSKADSLSQNITKLALSVNNMLDKGNFKSYPRANFDAQSLNATLTSTNWYNSSLYEKLTAPPPEPPIPFPWKKLVVAATLILTTVCILGYLFWYKPYQKDKNATRMYSFASSLTLRSSPAAGGDYNAIGNVLYGSEILVYSFNGDWVDCKANGQKGFVSSKYLLTKKDFHELNGILADPDTRDAIGTTKCRKALLNYFSTHNIMGKIDEQIQKEIYDSVQHKEVWQVFTKPKNSNPNTIAYPKVVSPNSKYTDFACIIKNVNTGKRKFLLFSFNDQEDPTLAFEQEAPNDGYIKSVTKSKGMEGIYLVSYTF